MVEAQFQLTELNPTVIIPYKLHMTELLGIYNMIIGGDLLNEMGLTLDFSTETITWNDASVPMKEPMATPIESFHIDEPKVIDNMVGRIAGDRCKKILKTKYKKANLEKDIIENSPQLQPKKQR